MSELRSREAAWSPPWASADHAWRGEVGFAVDSLLEGSGFELSVPRELGNKEPPKKQNHYLTARAPYKFESTSLQRRVRKLSVPPALRRVTWFWKLGRKTRRHSRRRRPARWEPRRAGSSGSSIRSAGLARCRIDPSWSGYGAAVCHSTRSAGDRCRRRPQ